MAVAPIAKPAARTTPPRPTKAWVAPANWKQKTQARWQASHPQPLFPSTDVTAKEQAGVMNDSRSSVLKSYAAAPMPSQQSYLQPFADASARANSAGANYVSYLDAASQNAQNLSGAFNAALTGGIQAGQGTAAAYGGSGTPDAIPSAGASLIPAASVGSSFSQMLSAEKPYVGAAVNEATGTINKAATSAAADYATAAEQRRSEIQDAIQKLYTSGLDTLQSSKIDANKAAVTEYLAMGKTAYQKAQLAQKTKHDTTTETIAQQNANTSATRATNTASYQQASLDLQRQKALKSSGIDTTGALKTLLVTTPGTAASGQKTGPQGQVGGYYTVTRTKIDEDGAPSGDGNTTVTQYVPYGKPLPKAGSGMNPDGSRWTTKVTLKSQKMPTKSAATSTRKATPASWDRAVQQLRAKWGAKITPAWLKANFPPRPTGS